VPREFAVTADFERRAIRVESSHRLADDVVVDLLYTIAFLFCSVTNEPLAVEGGVR
jgi:hypothetical protein